MPDDGVHETGVGPNDGARPHRGRPLQHDAGEQLDLGAEGHGGVDVGAGRVDHADALPHPVAVDPGPQRLLGLGQLDLVVDPHGLGHLGGLHGDDLVAGLAEDGDGVGQVVLALGVLRGQAAQRRRQQPPAEAVDRRVDLVDGPLLLGGVPVVDDGLDPPVLPPDDPAVAGRVGQAGGQHGGGGAALVVLPGQVGQRLGPQEGRVTGDDDEVVLLLHVVGEDGEPDGDGVARPPLDPLLDELQGDVGLAVEGLDDPLRGVAHDDDDPLQVELLQGADDVEQHRPAAQGMQHLGHGRLHPGALAGGEDHGGQRSWMGHGAPFRPPARGRGFEPRLGTPKDPVLPVTPPPTESTISIRGG